MNYSGRRAYYGLNVSPKAELEPVDQLDGFLVARYIQDLFGAEAPFYPYIAGAYNCLNGRSPREVKQRATVSYGRDNEKRRLGRTLMKNISIEGVVVITEDLWNDERYWRIVKQVIDDGTVETLPEELKTRGIRMADFPKEVLGVMDKALGRSLDYLFSGSLYVPVEVAEAIRLKELYGVEWKIGPWKTEQIYDELIYQYGIGIIGMEQPAVIENGEIRDALPYIGKPIQTQRILFSDTEATLTVKATESNPSFQRAMIIADTLESVTGVRLPNDRLKRILELIKLGNAD